MWISSRLRANVSFAACILTDMIKSETCIGGWDVSHVVWCQWSCKPWCRVNNIFCLVSSADCGLYFVFVICRRLTGYLELTFRDGSGLADDYFLPDTLL